MIGGVRRLALVLEPGSTTDIMFMCSASRGESADEAHKAAGALFLSHLLKDQVSTFVIINFVFWCYALSVVVTKVGYFHMKMHPQTFFTVTLVSRCSLCHV